jgi:hypothetical protein
MMFQQWTINAALLVDCQCYSILMLCLVEQDPQLDQATAVSLAALIDIGSQPACLEIGLAGHASHRHT